MLRGIGSRATPMEGRFGAAISIGGPTSQCTGPGLALLAPAADRSVGRQKCNKRLPLVR
jgi:hypothetical protein